MLLNISIHTSSLSCATNMDKTLMQEGKGSFSAEIYAIAIKTSNNLSFCAADNTLN